MVRAMFIHEVIARERARETLAQARERRLASSLAGLRRARRRAGRAQRRLRQAQRDTVRLRGSLHLEHEL